MGIRFTLGVVVVFALAVIIGVAAGKAQSQSAAPTAPALPPTPLPTPQPGYIDILPDPGHHLDGLYRPATFTVRVGGRVTWLNLDSQSHSIVADNGAFNLDVLNPGQKGSWTATRAGTYTYGDYLHPDMSGTIVVKP
ncbi:MAG TPA: hypothetical protein VKX16_04885 [Chloroflexota bacterium]|nr:hypothetical protein [Chloroflexota bacterium]